MKQYAWCMALVALMVCGGCGQQEKKRQLRPGQMVPVQGKGKLLSIDQALGMGTMEIKGKEVKFWWNNRSQTPGSEMKPELVVTENPFDARVGETVYFRGFESRNEIFLVAAAAVRK